MKKLHQLFKKIGFWKILDILKDWIDESNNNPEERPPQEWVNCLPYSSFYTRLDNIGNKNMFIRNKDILLQEQLIRIFKLNDHEKQIQLTPKGVELYQVLVYLKRRVFKNNLEGFKEW